MIFPEIPEICFDEYTYNHDHACCYRAIIIDDPDHTDGWTIEWEERRPKKLSPYQREDEEPQVYNIETSYVCGWCLAPFLEGSEVMPFCPGSHVLVLDNREKTGRYLIVGFDRELSPDNDPLLPCLTSKLGFYFSGLKNGPPYYTETEYDEGTVCLPLRPITSDGVVIPRGVENNGGYAFTISADPGKIRTLRSFQVPGFDHLVQLSSLNVTLTARKNSGLSYSFSGTAEYTQVDSSCPASALGGEYIGNINIQAHITEICLSSLDAIKNEYFIGSVPIVYHEKCGIPDLISSVSHYLYPQPGLYGFAGPSCIRRKCADQGIIRMIWLYSQEHLSIRSQIKKNDEGEEYLDVSYETGDRGTFTTTVTSSFGELTDPNIGVRNTELDCTETVRGSCVLAENNGKFELSKSVERDFYYTKHLVMDNDLVHWAEYTWKNDRVDKITYTLNDRKLGEKINSLIYELSMSSDRLSGHVDAWEMSIKGFNVCDANPETSEIVMISFDYLGSYKTIPSSHITKVKLQYITKDGATIDLESFESETSPDIGATYPFPDPWLNIWAVDLQHPVNDSATANYFQEDDLIDLRTIYATKFSLREGSNYPILFGFDKYLNIPIVFLNHKVDDYYTPIASITTPFDQRQCKIEYWYEGVKKTRYFVDDVEFTEAQVKLM